MVAEFDNSLWQRDVLRPLLSIRSGAMDLK